MMTTTTFSGYPILKRDMPRTPLVHGQRLGVGEVDAGYIVVNGPSEDEMFQLVSNNECIKLVYAYACQFQDICFYYTSLISRKMLTQSEIHLKIFSLVCSVFTIK